MIDVNPIRDVLTRDKGAQRATTYLELRIADCDGSLARRKIMVRTDELHPAGAVMVVRKESHPFLHEPRSFALANSF